MGHYDTAYEHDDKLNRTRKQIEAQRVKNNLDALRHSMTGSGLKYPPRFEGPLEDFSNWLKATYQVE